MNDGGEAGSEQIKLGKGMRNMRTRAEELGGEFRYTYARRYAKVLKNQLCIELSTYKSDT